MCPIVSIDEQSRSGNLTTRTMVFVLVLLAGCGLANIASAAPLVYTGYDVFFAKAAFADVTSPANQDFILPDVVLTRDNTRGIFNIAQESIYTDNSSPAGTTWAFAYNNPMAMLMADNWANLVFEDWQTALGGPGNLSSEILAGNGVVHFVDHDIYIDIRFTQWGIGPGAGGSFAYERSAIIPTPIPEPSSLLLATFVMLFAAWLRLRPVRRKRVDPHAIA
jgi:hypothetical protein